MFCNAMRLFFDTFRNLQFQFSVNMQNSDLTNFFSKQHVLLGDMIKSNGLSFSEYHSQVATELSSVFDDSSLS